MNDKDLPESTLEEVGKVQDLLNQEDERRESWNEKPYDGILGKLPTWVSEPIHRDYYHTRIRVLDAWGFTPEQVIESLDGYNRIGEDGNDWFCPRKTPKGDTLDRNFFIEVIGTLAHIKWGISLGPENGLFILSGADAVTGYRNRKNLKPRSVSELTIVMEKAYRQMLKSSGVKPSAKKVLISIIEFDSPTFPIIQEIDDDEEIIYWRTVKGVEKKTGFKQFANKLTEIRKPFSG
jgi:hypothetical protein